jgi:hypothetical protein
MGADYDVFATHYDAFTAHPEDAGWVRSLESLARRHGVTGSARAGARAHPPRRGAASSFTSVRSPVCAERTHASVTALAA